MAYSIYVMFGRPGAGKSTVADKVMELNTEEEKTGSTSIITCLDLDACIPKWMKEQFAAGIYPTLEQRNEFAVSACDYVDNETKKMVKQSDKVIISFSFVNTDLREIFIGRFPQSKWILIDTNESDAQDRINQREGHFYKGTPNDAEPKRNVKNEDNNMVSKPSNEWNFAPVTFDHFKVDGSKSVEENARKVIQIMNE